MDPAILSNGELCSANGPHGHSGMRLRVNLHWFGKVGLTALSAEVEDVAAFWIAFEIDQVDLAFIVHSRLRLNAIVWRAQQTDLRCGLARVRNRSNQEYKREEAKRNKAKNSCSFHSGNRDFIVIMYRVCTEFPYVVCHNLREGVLIKSREGSGRYGSSLASWGGANASWGEDPIVEI
jgi:hypothetical protein